MIRRSLAVLLACSAPHAVFAQVLITEVQSNPTSANDDGEWIEIQNTGAAAVVIDGWTLNDYTGTTPTGEVATRWAFPAGTTLSPGQVIVIAKFASATGYADNMPAGLYTMPPTFELASSAHDDAAVPNLIGTTLITLLNGGEGDAVVLRDAMGNVVSEVEWGSVDRLVSGAPAMNPGSAESIHRIANTGSSIVDFTIAMIPDPFVGYTMGMSTPPVVSGTFTSPRHVLHGQLLTVTATAVDPDGIASVELMSASATSSTGPASLGYSATPMTLGIGSSYSGTINPSPGAAPMTFHEVYLREFVRATDNAMDVTTEPPGATTAAGNTEYRFRNVMPPAASPISDARAQGADGHMLWRNHSARVEGVVLTRRAAFVANRTNFFIMSLASNDAIRVFSNTLVPQDVQPGDIVRVTGMLDTFNGLRQIGEPDLAVEVLGTGAPVASSVHTIADLNANGEPLESQLVEVTGLTFVMAQTTWPMNGNVDVTDGTGTITVRVPSVVSDLAGMPAPVGAFDLRGILGQFSTTGAGGYQILPRGVADVTGNIPPPPDGGTIDVDGGLAMDTGSGMDTGGGFMDAAVIPDLGPRPDTGTMMGADAAEQGDGGASDEDATTPPRMDSGSGGKGGSGGRSDEGCGCSSSERPRSADAFAAIMLLGLMFALRRLRS